MLLPANSLAVVQERLEKEFGLLIPDFHSRWFQNQLGFLARHHEHAGRLSFVADLQSRPACDQIWDSVIHAVTVHETYFFRNGPAMVKALESIGRQEESIRFLSLGCSFGQEVYTAYLIGRSMYPDTRILGTGVDISAECVEVASTGVFERRSDVEALLPYLNCGDLELRGSQFRFSESARSNLQFIQGNILRVDDIGGGPYQIIFCQNCLTYYDDQTRRSVSDELSAILEPGGILVFACAELMGKTPRNTVPLSDEWPQIFVKEL